MKGGKEETSRKEKNPSLNIGAENNGGQEEKREKKRGGGPYRRIRTSPEVPCRRGQGEVECPKGKRQLAYTFIKRGDDSELVGERGEDCHQKKEGVGLSIMTFGSRE